MSKGLFITGTDTDIGKTYVTALIVKTLRKSGYDAGTTRRPSAEHPRSLRRMRASSTSSRTSMNRRT